MDFVLAVRLRFFLLLLAASFFAGCGGGGGGGSSQPATVVEPTTLSGIVADGARVAGATVLIFFKDMPASGLIPSAVTDASGKYSISVAGFAPPYLVYVDKHATNFVPYQRLVSIAWKAGVANVTPLTDLEATKLLASPLPYFVADKFLPNIGVLTTYTQAQRDAAHQAVVDYFLQRPSRNNQAQIIPVDVSAIGDFVTAVFSAKAGDRYDDALEAVQQSLPGEGNIFGLEEHFMHSAVPPLNLTNLPFSKFRCDFYRCGYPDSTSSTNVLEPYFDRMAIVKVLTEQLAQQGAVNLQCSNNSSFPDVIAGNNVFAMDRSVLRMQPSQYAIDMLSAHTIDVVFDSAPIPHIASFWAISRDGGGEARYLALTFDKNGVLTQLDRVLQSNNTSYLCNP